MDQQKVRAIEEWKTPTKVTELRAAWSTIFYRRFIPSHSHRAAALTDLFRPWHWSESCQAAFMDLKQAVMSEPVLQLQDSSRGTHRCLRLSRVLVQGGHPVAFESRKLSKTEKKEVYRSRERKR